MMYILVGYANLYWNLGQELLKALFGGSRE